MPNDHDQREDGPPPTPTGRGTDRWWMLAVAGLPALILLLHRATLGAYLFEDDVQWILTGQTSSLGDVFAWSGRSVFYRPMVGVHFLFFAGWLGGAPWLLHLINVALHAVNALLVYRLARALGLLPPAAFTAALIAAVATRSFESVAWISGISSVLLTTFFLLAHLLDRRAARSRRWTDRLLSLGSFAAALLTHEAGATLLPLLVLAAWWREPAVGGLLERTRQIAWRYGLHAALLLGYLLVALSVNRGSFVVTEGHYRLGWHWVDNLSHYLVSMYVGRPDLLSRVVTLGLFVLALALKHPAGRLGATWTLLTLLPYCFFTWGLTWRYLYLPAVGFALTLASLVPAGGRARHRGVARVVTVVAVAFVAGRFALFGAKVARDASTRTGAYRAYVERFRGEHPSLAPGAAVTVPPPREGEPRELYLEPLLRVALGDPALRVSVSGR